MLFKCSVATCVFPPYFGVYWFTGNYPANEETLNSTLANFKGFPGTNGSMSPLKDTKVNLLLNFWG